MDERLLLGQVAGGDEEAMRQLYFAYRPRLRRYLWHQLGGDMSRVEEALQDIFLAVWRSAGGYRGDARVSTWVYRIAHNVALDARRRLARYPQPLRLAAFADEDDPDLDGNVATPDAGADDEETLLDRLALADAIGRLSEKHRDALALVFQQGFSLEEAAQVLDVPLGTIKSRISYARKALLRELSATSRKEARRES
jgi:RNA polymerase sigma-70 factor, ECF subfamily